MKTSESISKLAPALLEAQKAITFAVKDSVNPHYKNRYADVGAVIEAVKGPLNLHGITFIQAPSPSEDGRLHLTTRLLHSSGEWIEDTAVCPLPKADPQGFGSALTYLRRYSLGAFLGVPSEDDDGEAARPQPAKEKPAAAKETPVSTNPMAIQADTLKQLRFFAQSPKTQPLVEKVMAAKELAVLEEFSEEQAVKTIAWIESQLKLLEKAK